MKFQVYRATRNILPNQICEYYSPQESNYLHGNGMYFAFKRGYSEQFVARQSGYAVLGYFEVMVGSFIQHFGNRYQVEPDSELGRLQELYIIVETERKEIWKSFGLKNVQEDPRYELGSKELQDQILQEAIIINTEIEERVKTTPIWDKFQSLRELSKKITLQYEAELDKVDAVVDSDDSGTYSGELALKKMVPITLLSFDVYCSEEEAQKIYQTIKVGEISDQGIMNISGEYADEVSKILHQKKD